MYVFSGSVSAHLATSLATLLGAKRGEVEQTMFANGEKRLRVISEHIGSKAVVVQSLQRLVETNLIEFCFLVDALTRMGVEGITAVIPWLGYSKQDKVFRSGEALSVHVVAKILGVVPIKHLYIVDVHDEAILSFFDVPVTNLSAQPLFINYFKENLPTHTVIVAPDDGAIVSSTAFGKALGIPVVYVDKKRDLKTGAVEIKGIRGEVAGREVIVIDDMIATGGTIVQVAGYIKKRGATRIRVGATHHLYVPGAQEAVEQSGVDEIIVTDTITGNIRSKKLTVLSVGPLLANELKHIT